MNFKLNSVKTFSLCLYTNIFPKTTNGRLINTNAKEYRNNRLELTIIIIKPHICNNSFIVEEIRNKILNDEFIFIRSLLMTISKKHAESFYEEHRDKFFFNRLVSMMLSGESWIHLLARNNAIQRWRDLMGPTKVFKSIIEKPETIRGSFGFTDTRNATHGSDSIASVNKEVKSFFPEFNIEKWFTQEEPKWRQLCNDNGISKLIFDKKNLIHKIN